MSTPETTSTKPTERLAKRRRFRFTIRSLLVVTALCAVWVANQTYRARQQASAVKTLQRLGGAVRFDYQVNSLGQQIPNAEPAAPKWLRNTIGEDYFRTVVTADIAMANFRQHNTSQAVIDEAMNAIAPLSDVRVLELGGNLLIDDTALAKLAGLSRIETLYLYKTNVRGSGLGELKCRNLTGLSLTNTPIEDAGLVWLANFPKLKSLHLWGTKITDAGLVHLKQLRSLESLGLVNTDITDQGLAHLAALPNLRELSVFHTQVTPRGVESLQAALPKCQIIPGAESLDRKPVDYSFWTPGTRPTFEQIAAAVQELEGQCTNQSGRTELVLMDSNISDDSFIEIVQALPQLNSANLRRLLIGDRSVQALAEDSPDTLLLVATNITDESLKTLAAIPDLKELSLDETRITDAGLLHLHNASRLRRLSLNFSRVTPQAVAKLREALPKCSINY